MSEPQFKWFWVGSGGGRAGEKEVELGGVAHLTNVRVLWSKGDLTDGLISSLG